MRTPSHVFENKGTWNQPTISMPASPRASTTDGAVHSLWNKHPRGPQRVHNSYGAQETSQGRGSELEAGEVDAMSFILKSRVEPYDGRWPKDSASPMVLPLDADSQMSGSVDISRLPSMEEYDALARFLQKATPSRTVSGSLRLMPDTVEVELSDDTEDDASPR